MSRTKASMMDVERERGDEYIPQSNETESRYFGAVIDIIEQYGTFDEVQDDPGSPYRYFNDKFVDTPEKALAVACDVYHKRHNDSMSEILKDVRYDAENDEYTFTAYFTTNNHRPTEKQMKRWLANDPEFRLFRVTYAIQVYETDLVRYNLLNKAKYVEFLNKRH